jgi:hypothetical protein
MEDIPLLEFWLRENPTIPTAAIIETEKAKRARLEAEERATRRYLSGNTAYCPSCHIPIPLDKL